MKVILYMAISANGMIAMEDDSTPWPKEVWEHYRKTVKRVGNLIIGKRTYEIMQKAGEFEELGNPRTVVVTREHHPDDAGDNFVFVDSPKAALEALEKRGFDEVLVGGGAELVGSFLKEKLVDEMYLAVAPKLFGKGIALFPPQEFHYNLDLLDVKKLGTHTLLVHYQIVQD